MNSQPFQLFVVIIGEGGDYMEDCRIIELYWQRNETAIEETHTKYGHYLSTISMNIVKNLEDMEECVNDTYLHAWNSIPPTIPNILKVYLGTIVRNLSLDCYKKRFTTHHAANQFTVLLSELEECLPAAGSVEQTLEDKEIAAQISRFLRTLSTEKQQIFIRRYFYCEDIKEISKRLGFSQSKVKSALFDTRKKLRKHLEKEGITL